MKRTGPTNPITVETIAALRKAKKPLWKDIADRLEKATRSRVEVDISKIEKTAKEGETVVVPGKVLASGKIKRKIDVAALNFSMGAVMAITGAKGKCLSIRELIEQNPDGKNIRIMA